MNCPICQNTTNILYDGKVRVGKPGTKTPENKKIYKCENCEVTFLEEYNINYESDEYRNLVNDDASPENYYKKHDHEQIERIQLIGLENIRYKTCADIGCGAGAFLDLVSAAAKEAIAIEPTMSFKPELERKGYIHFPYASNAIGEYKNKIDILTSFAVIEHVEDAESFLKDCHDLLSDDGMAILSTPNHSDWLIDFIGKEYQEFFYRNVHKWYFNANSFSYLADKVGFKKIQPIFKQQYDVSNFIHWLKDLKPTGLAKDDTLSELDTNFQRVLEEKGISNYIYFKLFK